MLRSRRAPRSAAISCPRAAAAVAPRSRRLLPSYAPQPVPRCRLGSGGCRRCSGPARPARPLSREGRLGGASLLQRSREGGEQRGGSVHSGAGGWVGRSPGSRRRHPPPTRAPHTSARGAETAGVGGGGPGRASPAHARLPHPHPEDSSAARPRSNPGGRLAGRGGGPAPLPLLPGAADRRGARAGSCCWRQGNPGEADPPPLPPCICPFGAASRPRGEIHPLPLTSRTPPVAET